MLTRATTVLAVLFMIGSIGLAIAWQKGPSSVVSGVKTPAAPAAPATPPAAPARSRTVVVSALIAEVAELADAPA